MRMEASKRHDGLYNLWREHNQIDAEDTSRWEVIGVYDNEQLVYRELESRMTQAARKNGRTSP